VTVVILCCDSNNGERKYFCRVCVWVCVWFLGSIFGFDVVDFSQRFGFAVVEWVAFP
jgi:hypothetical protein